MFLHIFCVSGTSTYFIFISLSLLISLNSPYPLPLSLYSESMPPPLFPYSHHTVSLTASTHIFLVLLSLAYDTAVPITLHLCWSLPCIYINALYFSAYLTNQHFIAAVCMYLVFAVNLTTYLGMTLMSSRNASFYPNISRVHINFLCSEFAYSIMLILL